MKGRLGKEVESRGKEKGRSWGIHREEGRGASESLPYTIDSSNLATLTLLDPTLHSGSEAIEERKKG